MTGGELLPIVKMVSDAGDAASKAVPSKLGEAISYTLADVWNRIVGDRVVGWRIANVATIESRLSANLAAKGLKLDMSKIPERIAFGWFEEASKQDEPEIQAIFAKLLENAATGNVEALQRRNIDLAGKLTPSDALLLKHLAEWVVGYNHMRVPDYTRISLELGSLKFHIKRQHDFEDDQSFENLVNLGLMKLFTSSSIDQDRVRRNASRMLSSSSIPNFGGAIKETTMIAFSLTGISLMNALSLLPVTSSD